MLLRIVVLIGGWAALLVIGGFLIELMNLENFIVEVVLIFVVFVFSMLTASAATDRVERWQKKKGLVTSDATRALQSKVIVAIGFATVFGGIAFSLSEHPLGFLGILAAAVIGGNVLIIGGGLHPTAFTTLYHKLVAHGIWLGWGLMGIGTLMVAVYQPTMLSAFGAGIAFMGFVLLGFASAERNNQDNKNNGKKAQTG